MLGMPDLMESTEQAFRRRAVWQLKFVYWPRRCSLSRRWIWPLSYAYRGTAMRNKFGTTAYEHQWHHSVAHLVCLLRGNSK
jgi:hypothetical protein